VKPNGDPALSLGTPISLFPSRYNFPPPVSLRLLAFTIFLWARASTAPVLESIPTKDLYYLKRICDDSCVFSKRFFYELNATKHDYTNTACVHAS
jgi:hypothetical protein